MKGMLIMAKGKGKTLKSKVVKVDHQQDEAIQRNEQKYDCKRSRSLTMESRLPTESKQRRVFLRESKIRQ